MSQKLPAGFLAGLTVIPLVLFSLNSNTVAHPFANAQAHTRFKWGLCNSSQVRDKYKAQSRFSSRKISETRQVFSSKDFALLTGVPDRVKVLNKFVWAVSKLAGDWWILIEVPSMDCEPADESLSGKSQSNLCQWHCKIVPSVVKILISTICQIS